MNVHAGVKSYSEDDEERLTGRHARCIEAGINRVFRGMLLGDRRGTPRAFQDFKYLATTSSGIEIWDLGEIS